MNKTKGPDLMAKMVSAKRKLVYKLCRTFADAGFECYIVGGAVRDLLLGQSAKDLDFASNAHPKDVEKLFRRTIPTGIKHGTITVRLQGNSFEVTSYRSESIYLDARHPEKIEFASSLSEDLTRRDFTINALAYEPLQQCLVDDHEGQKDLENKTIRAIGRAKDRFYEDGLRAIRACRFAATLDFSLEEKTHLALGDPLIHKRVAQIAMERFSQELEKGFAAKKVSRMIDLLEKSGLLLLFTPEYQKGRHSSVEERRCLDNLYPSPPVFRMAYWRYRLGFASLDFLKEWGNHLKLSKTMIRDLHHYCCYFKFQKEMKDKLGHGKTNDFLRKAEHSYAIRIFLSGIKEVYAEKSIDFIEGTNQYSDAPVSTQLLLQFYKNYPLGIKDLQVNGQDLISLGLEGVQVGAALQGLLSQVLLQPELNTKRDLLALLKDNLKKTSTSL